MKKHLIIISLIFICNNLFAQITFQRIYADTGGFSAFDKAVRYSYCIDKTLDDGFIMGANTYPTGSGNASLLRLNYMGDTLWTRTYNFGTGTGNVTSVVATADSGFIAGIGGNVPPYLIKTNSNGDLIWAKSYTGFSNADYSVIQTSDGGYASVVSASGMGTGSSDGYIIKMNSNGDTLWTNVIGGSLTDEFFDLKQTGDGGYIAVGRTRSFVVGGDLFDGYAVKFDNAGDTMWTRVYGTNSPDYLKSVCQTTDGGYAIAGYNSSGLFLIRTNSMGDTLFSKLFSNSTCDGQCIRQTSDGGFAIVGKAFNTDLDLLLLRVDSSGNIEWSKTYGGNAPDYGFDLQISQDNGFILCGAYGDFGASSVGSGAYLIKTDSLGECSCNVFSITLPATNLLPAIGTGGVLNHGGSVAISNPIVEQTYIEQTVFCFNVGIGEEENNEDAFVIFPNPTSENITIQFKDIQNEAQISILDLSGRIINSFSIWNQSNTSLSVSELANGMYFVGLETKNHRTIQKLILNR